MEPFLKSKHFCKHCECSGLTRIHSFLNPEGLLKINYWRLSKAPGAERVQPALPVAPRGLPSPPHMAQRSWEMKGATPNVVSPSSHMTQSCAPELHSPGADRYPAVTGPPYTFYCYTLPQASAHYHDKRPRHFRRGVTLSSTPPPTPPPTPTPKKNNGFIRKQLVAPSTQDFFLALNLFQQLIICEVKAAEEVLRQNEEGAGGGLYLVMPPH